MNAELDRQRNMAKRASAIANELNGGPPAKCSGHKADKWQASWDGAMMALGGDPTLYRGLDPWPDNPAYYTDAKGDAA